MSKSILAGLIALGVGVLCDKPKPPSMFDGQRLLIKAEGISCGFMSSFELEGAQIMLRNVTLDKSEVGRIWSGGFIVKPAQRVGMTLEIVQDGEARTLTNVWVEEMTPYREGRDSVTIDQMVCLIENQEEQPEQESVAPKLIPSVTNIKLNLGDNLIGIAQTASINLDDKNPKVKLFRTRFDRLRVQEAFLKGFIDTGTQRSPFQIEIQVDGKTVGKIENFWLTKASDCFVTENIVVLDSIEGECETAKFYEDL